jgi:hypothetical protein
MNFITETTRRAGHSRIANDLRKAFDNTTLEIHVSENAPCSIKYDRTTPTKEGWKEIEKTGNWVNTVNEAVKEYNAAPIHIKTATLGGRSRIWVKVA